MQNSPESQRKSFAEVVIIGSLFYLTTIN